jgi:hypothetical protein
MKFNKTICLLTSLVIALSSTLTKVHASTLSTTPTPDEPQYPSTTPWGYGEDIVAQDTVWKYGVTQITSLGASVAVASAMLTMSGVVQITDNEVKNFFAGEIGAFALDYIFNLNNTVNIEFNRYYVRCADGVMRYEVYASYYELDGTFIDAKLVQQGVA